MYIDIEAFRDKMVIIKKKLIEKAYEIDFSKIEDGYLACEQICYAKTRNEARHKLLSMIKYDDWKIKYTHSDITYLNIPIKRKYSSDKFEYNSEIHTYNDILYDLQKCKRNDELNEILLNKSIKYCYIIKHGLYYADNYCGYSEYIQNAGIYLKENAISHAKGCNDIIIKPINIKEHNNYIKEKIKLLKEKIIK